MSKWKKVKKGKKIQVGLVHELDNNNLHFRRVLLSL